MIRRFEKLFYFIFLCWEGRFVSDTRALTHNTTMTWMREKWVVYIVLLYFKLISVIFK